MHKSKVAQVKSNLWVKGAWCIGIAEEETLYWTLDTALDTGQRTVQLGAVNIRYDMFI